METDCVSEERQLLVDRWAGSSRQTIYMKECIRHCCRLGTTSISMEEVGGGGETAAPGLDWAATVLVYRCTALYWPAGEPGGGGGSHRSGENRLPLPGEALNRELLAGLPFSSYCRNGDVKQVG